MMKKQNTKRALLMSTLALLLCVSMLVGTTFAWFTDSVTSAGNIIKSGNLDIEMYWADGTKDPATAEWKDASQDAIFNYENWEPGYVEVRHIKIANVGTLALKYQVAIVANGEVSDLSDVIDVYYMDPATMIADRADLAGAQKLGTLTEVLAAIPQSAAGNLVGNSEDTITLALKMQESAGNAYMNKAIGTDFSVVLTATQLTYEPDSFDNQYDKYSDYENVVRAETFGDIAASFDMTKDTVVVLPAGEITGNMISMHGTGDSDSDFIMEGKGATFTNDLEINSHANLKLSDEATLVIDGITVNGVLKVVSYHKNIIIKNVKAESIEVYDRGNVTIENCTLDGAGDNGIYVVAATDGYDLTLRNNVIKNSQKNAVQISGCATGATFSAGKFVVEGNTFENWCQKNDKPRAAFKVWGDGKIAPEDITATKTLTEEAVALTKAVAANNTFVAYNANQPDFDFYGYTFDSLSEVTYDGTATLFDTIAGLQEGQTLVIPEGTYVTTGSFKVPAGVTITAAKGATVTIRQDSAGQDNIFNCEGDVVIKNINFESNRKGYAITDNTKNHDTDGNITVIGCNFKGIAAEKNWAIYKNVYGSLTVKDCTFDNYNNALCGIKNGGDSTTTITGCTFTNINSEAIGYVAAEMPANFEAEAIASNTGLTAENVIGY